MTPIVTSIFTRSVREAGLGQSPDASLPALPSWLLSWPFQTSLFTPGEGPGVAASSGDLPGELQGAGRSGE